MSVVLSPSLATYAACGEIVHSIEYSLISKIHVGAECVEASCAAANIIVPAEISHIVSHYLCASPQLIAQSHHHK